MKKAFLIIILIYLTPYLTAADVVYENSDNNLNALEAIQVRREIFIPLLDDIFNNPIYCEEVIDSEEALQEYMNLGRMFESAYDVLDFMDDELEYSLYRGYGINAQLERNIQAGLEGHIVYGIPNRTTIEAYIQIWKETPCSEAAILALMKIGSIISQPDYLRIVTINGTPKLSFGEEVTRLNQFIIDNYPNTWEAEISRYGISLAQDEANSVERMQALERWIEYAENNQVYENRYYCINNRNAKRDFVTANYSILQTIYINRGELIAERGLHENGVIPPEAIDMYNRHRDLCQRRRELYPEYERVSPLSDGSLPRLYQLIRDYAPEHFVEEPEVVEQPEE